MDIYRANEGIEGTVDSTDNPLQYRLYNIISRNRKFSQKCIFGIEMAGI